MNISERLHHLLSSARSHPTVRIERSLVVAAEESKVNTDLGRRRTRQGDHDTRCPVCKECFIKTESNYTEEMRIVFKQVVLQSETALRENDFCKECLKAVKQIADLKRQAQSIEDKINAIAHFLRRAINTELKSSIQPGERSDPCTEKADGDINAVEEVDAEVKVEISEDYFEDDEGSFLPVLYPDASGIDAVMVGPVSPEVEKNQGDDDNEEYNLPEEDNSDNDFELKSSPAKQEPKKRRIPFKPRKTPEQKKTCRICSQSFETIRLRIKHFTNAHSVKEKKKIILKKPKDSLPKICNICEKPFKDKRSLHQHILAVHEKVKPHQCSLCQKTFFSNSTLTNHLAVVHNIGQKKCSSCNLSFEFIKDRIHHERTVHLNKPTFLCEHCSKIFYWKTRLEVHQGVCGKTKEEAQRRRTNICNICGAGFTRTFRLEQHIAEAHEKLTNFLCHICSKSFYRQHHLDQHILKQHTPKEERMKCGICNLSFKTLNETNLHNKTIHLRKPIFPCPHCPAVYDISSTLERHLKIHEVKPDRNESKSNLMV